MTIYGKDETEADKKSKRRSWYFNDGERKVDYILVHRKFKNTEKDIEARKKRKAFYKNLKQKGLHLEAAEDDASEQKNEVEKILLAYLCY